MDTDILTIEEVAGYLRVSERTVYDWASKGEIPSGKIGTSWRFKRGEIERWVDRKLGASNQQQVPSISIAQVLVAERCRVCVHATKLEILNEMIDALVASGHVGDRGALADAVFRREQLMSTGIGLGIGLPHVRLAGVVSTVMAIGVAPKPVADYESLDALPVRIVVMIAAGEGKHAEHVRLLSQVSTKLKDGMVRERLLSAASSREIYDTITA